MATIEQTARMEVLRKSVEEKVLKYNEAILGGDFNTAAKLDEEMQNEVNEFTSLAKTICFEECANTSDPMMTAIKKLTFTTIGTRDTKTGENKTPVRTVVEKEKQIDILKLHKAIEGGIGHDKGWNFAIEHFNLMLTMQQAIDLGLKPTAVNDSYSISEMSRQRDLGKNPTSKTNMLKTLTNIVQAMIGEEYKATSHDVNFLLSVYGKKSREALTVTCANHKALRGYLMEICHRIVLDKEYKVDYKKKK